MRGFKRSWQRISDATADRVFNTQLYNKFIENLEWLKERFEKEHTWADGLHDADKMGWFGPVAYSAIVGAGAANAARVNGSDFNVDAVVVRTGVGNYTVSWTNNLVAFYGLLLTVNNFNYYGHTGGQVAGSANFAIRTRAADALVDLAVGEYCYISAWNAPDAA